MNELSVIIFQKIEEANSSLSLLESKCDSIRATRKRLDDEDVLIADAKQKLLTKLEAWSELVAAHQLPAPDSNHEIISLTKETFHNDGGKRRDRRPSDKWLAILKCVQDTPPSDLVVIANNLYPELKFKGIKDQIKRYKTSDFPLLIESQGKLNLTDKAKAYLKAVDDEEEKKVRLGVQKV